MRLVARYADACNFLILEPDEIRAKLEVLRAHCDEIGRDYDEIEITALDEVDLLEGLCVARQVGRCLVEPVGDRPQVAVEVREPAQARVGDEPRPHELAQLLQQSARATRPLTGSYNAIFMNFPGQPRAHWYVEIVPRSAMIAGFEIGSATAINTVEAADAAERLRTGR